MKFQFEIKLDGKVPFEVINMAVYGMMNGENVLKQALTLMGE